jgi:hypothetical protein
MDKNRQFWAGWAQILHRFKLGEPASVLLEAVGPLSVILAQLAYIGQPFMPNGQGQALAHMLEDRQESQEFAAYLHEEDSRP